MVQKMMLAVSSLWCLVLLLAGPQLGVCSAVSPSVVIDGYTRNSILDSGSSVQLGTQLILVCQVVGLPYETPLSYTWTCPNKCNEVGYYGRKIYNGHILAVNTTSTSDGGTYTCQVTAMYPARQEVNGSFTVRVAGGRVVHSFGRLIPHEFPISNLQQISSPNDHDHRTGMITCTPSSGTASFSANGGQLESDGVTQMPKSAAAVLVANPTNNFQNKGVYCTSINLNYFYLFISKRRFMFWERYVKVERAQPVSSGGTWPSKSVQAPAILAAQKGVAKEKGKKSKAGKSRTFT